MKSTILSFLLLLFSVMTVGAQEKQPAFPGAEGYARYVTGGRGGKVYYVTNLNDSGEGSLRWAINQTGKRTILFKVSGTIFLQSALSINSGDVTIAGQSAPGDGICVADYPFTINANNVIIRYMRFRLGQQQVAYHEGDGLGAMDHEGIMIDHCSVSWSIDECLSVLGNKNTTVQWCISSHSLVNAGHVKGAHGYGGNWGGDHASFHHNLMIHHVSRTPRLGPRPTTQLNEHMDMRNNVIYNWAGNGCYGGEGMDVNIVNNYYKPGPGTPTNNAVAYRLAGIGVRTNSYVTTYPAYAPALHKWGHLYVNGNFNPQYASVTNDNWTYGIYSQVDASGCDGTFTQMTKDTIRLSEPIDFIYTTTHSAKDAYERVLDYVGCSKSRDSYDAELINDARSGTASHQGIGLSKGFINSQEDLRPDGAGDDWSPWPTLNSTTAPLDSDGDGIPNTYEEFTLNTDPYDATDGAQVASNGYTNLENYLNSLVSDITAAQNAGGVAEGDIVEVGSDVPETLEISARTSDGTGNFGSDDYKIIGTSGNKLTTATSGVYMKASRNTDYTFKLPEGIKVSSIKVEGYMNGDTGTGYVWKVGNLTLGSKNAANDYVLRNRKASGAGDDNYTFTFSPALEGSITLAVTGDAQSAIIATLYVEDTHTAVTSIAAAASPRSHNIYSIDGRLLISNASQAQVSGLTKGIYIMNGKKLVVR